MQTPMVSCYLSENGICICICCMVYGVCCMLYVVCCMLYVVKRYLYGYLQINRVVKISTDRGHTNTNISG